MKSKSGVLKKIGIGLICISLLGSSVNISALANEKSVADSKFSEGLAVEQPKGEAELSASELPMEATTETTGELPKEATTEAVEPTGEQPKEEITETTEVQPEEEIKEVTEEKPEEEAKEVTEVTEEKPEEEAKEVTEVTEEKPEEGAKEVTEVTEVTEEKPEEGAKEVTEVTEEKPEKEATEVTEEKPEEEAKETTEGQPKEDKEITEEEIEEVAFNETTCVGDVEISVTADEGVFPKGAVLKASEAKQAEENIAEDVIAELRDESVNVAKSYTFDIKVLNKDGEEIEPDTKKGEVSVSFKLKEAEDINLDTQIYHIEGDMSDSSSLSATELSVVPDADGTDSQVVTALTDGFSYYTVEFTYNSMEYVLEGDEKVELTTILDCVGLDYSAGIEEVKGSNDELFYPCEEDGIWYIAAATAFDTNEELSVTIGGIEYVIDVTDATYVASFTVNGTTTNYSTFAEAVSTANSTAGGVIKLLSDTSTGAF